MNSKSMSPQESLELISQIIEEARCRISENGFLFFLWGAILAFCGIVQFALLHSPWKAYNYYPYLLTIPGFLYSWYYSVKKAPSRNWKANIVGKTISWTWIVLGSNMMLLGFFYYSVLKNTLIPYLLLLTAIGVIVTGLLLAKRELFYLGLAVNGIALLSFFAPLTYQPLLMAVSYIFALLIPGWKSMQYAKHSS